MTNDFESKLKKYKGKHPNHLQNWKKIRALVNFSRTLTSFKEWEALEFLVRYFSNHYLTAKDEEWLDDVLSKYSIEYLDWCNLTPWVKNRIAASNTRKKSWDQLHFWFPELEKDKFAARLEAPLCSNIERHKLIYKRNVA